MSRRSDLLRYLAARLALAPVMVWLIASLVFLLLRVAPGDPIDALLGSRAPAARCVVTGGSPAWHVDAQPGTSAAVVFRGAALLYPPHLHGLILTGCTFFQARRRESCSLTPSRSESWSGRAPLP